MMKRLATAFLSLLVIAMLATPSSAGVLKRIFGEEFGATW